MAAPERTADSRSSSHALGPRPTRRAGRLPRPRRAGTIPALPAERRRPPGRPRAVGRPAAGHERRRKAGRGRDRWRDLTDRERTAGRPDRPVQAAAADRRGGHGHRLHGRADRPGPPLVALKVIKAGMDGRQVLARFEAERQALAMMDHPNIARVLDAGATDGGPPLLRHGAGQGRPDHRYCDEHRLSTRERIELFVPVCQAVQHAHQKGVIHRDLKPSNVLVALYDGEPVPKVIDFGVAKATGRRLTDQTLYTEFGAVVGTLEYMSPGAGASWTSSTSTPAATSTPRGAPLRAADRAPRRWTGKRLAQAAFTGGAPADPRGGAADAEHAALDDRRSCRRSRPAGSIEPRRLSGLVRGELDWIVMKVPGEGPHPAVRDGQRPGRRPAALPGR